MSKDAEEAARSLGGAETRRKAITLISQTERLLRYQAEKISDEDKADIETKLSTLKSSLGGEDDEAIRYATEAWLRASQRFRQKLYEQASAKEAAANAAGASDDGQPGGAKPAEQVRGVEDRLAEAQAAAEDSWSRLTRDIGEILRLLGEQAQRAAEEAAAEATNIISAAHADAAAVTAQAEAARRTTQEATEALRQRVAENIGVELALHDELAEAAQAIEDDMSIDPGSQPSAEDPLAQAVRDAVDRASTSPR